MEPDIFKLDKKHLLMLKVSLVIFITFLAFSFALPFIEDEGKNTILIMISTAIVWGSSTILTLITLKKLSYADIAVDDDGIWYNHQNKNDSIIPWSTIAKVNDRSAYQRLELIGVNDNKLLQIEYLLNNFNKLRAIINKKTSTIHQDIQLPATYNKSSFFYIFNLIAILIFSALGIYVGITKNPLLGYGGMSLFIIMIIHEYLSTPYKLHLDIESLTIFYPLIKRDIAYNNITSIELSNTSHKGYLFPELQLICHNIKQSHKIKGLGISENELYLKLKNVSGL